MDQFVIKAWTAAAKELGVSIEVPFEFELDSGEIIKDLLLVKDFGSKLGTLIDSMNLDNRNELIKEASEREYYYSAINLESYKNYNRQLFIDTLNDWGYFGKEEEKPEWYTGKPWS